jgi:hypothetical protein
MTRYNRYYKLQKLYLGEPVDPPEYKIGPLYDENLDYPSKEDCENGGSGEIVIEYRWIVDGTMCIQYNKHKREIEQESKNGEEWTNTGSERAGSLIQSKSPECDYISNDIIINKEIYVINPTPVSEAVFAPNLPISPTLDVKYNIRPVYDLKNKTYYNAVYAIIESKYYYNILNDNGSTVWKNWLYVDIVDTNPVFIYDNYFFSNIYRYDITNGERIRLNLPEANVFSFIYFDKYLITDENKVIDILLNASVSTQYAYQNKNNNYSVYSSNNSVTSDMTEYMIDNSGQNAYYIRIENREPGFNILKGGDSNYLYTNYATNFTTKAVGFIDINNKELYDAFFTYEKQSDYLNEQIGCMKENRIFYTLKYNDVENIYTLRKFNI